MKKTDLSLCEGAAYTGKTAAEFSEVVADFQKSLAYRRVDGREVIFGYYDGRNEDGDLVVSYTRAGDFEGWDTEVFPAEDYPEEMLNELEDRKICLIEDGKITFMSWNVEFSELGMKGTFFLAPPKEAVIAIAKAAESKKLTFITRKVDDVRKLFAIRSAKYTSIPQTVIFECIKALEDTCHTDAVWDAFRVTSLYTEVFISLPEIERKCHREYHLPTSYTPALRIATSDTGDGCFSVSEAWKISSDRYLIGNSVSHKHSGRFNVMEFAEEVETRIYNKIFAFPEKLAEAALIDVSPLSLSHSGVGKAVNRKNFEDTVKAISKYIELTKVVGKKSEIVIREAILDDFNEDLFYSLFDVISCFLALPDRVLGLGEAKINALSSCVMKAAYYRPKSTPTVSVM